jgi:hypothetical protein
MNKGELVHESFTKEGLQFLSFLHARKREGNYAHQKLEN